MPSACRRKWQPTPVFLPGESHRQRNLEGYSPWGCKESDTTEATEHMPRDGEDTARQVQMPQCNNLFQGWTDLKMQSDHFSTLSYRKKKVEEEVTLQTSLPITENQSGELSRIVWTTSGSSHICGSCSYTLKLITISVSLTADIPVKLRVRVDTFTSCRPFSPTQDPQCNQGARGEARDRPRGATEHIIKVTSIGQEDSQAVQAKRQVELMQELKGEVRARCVQSNTKRVLVEGRETVLRTGGVSDNCLCPQESKTVPNPVRFGSCSSGSFCRIIRCALSFSCAGDEEADSFPPQFSNCSKEAISGNAQLLLQNDRYQ